MTALLVGALGFGVASFTALGIAYGKAHPIKRGRHRA